MKLFFIVGENSGDALAAPLINTLHNIHGDDLTCMGIGGPLMKAESFEELLPMDQISVIGIWEVIPKIPRLIKIKQAIVEEIEQQQPDAVITVDFPDFNFIIAKSLKKRGIFKGKIIHYVSPSVWAWRPGRAKKISEFLDGIMCLFPMEVAPFKEHGLSAAHVGHPLVTSTAREADGNDFRKANNISDDARTLGLFFGSRESEFKNMSAILKETAMLINDVSTSLHIIAPTLPKLEYNVQQLLEDFKLPVYVSANPNVKWQAFKACDVAIVVSGTVALELAYAGVPHVIAYRINPITALILKFMVKIKHAHLANILLGKEIVPECLQSKCTSENIAGHIMKLFDDKDAAVEQTKEFKNLDDQLGGQDGMTPSEKAAEFISNSLLTK